MKKQLQIFEEKKIQINLEIVFNKNNSLEKEKMKEEIKIRK